MNKFFVFAAFLMCITSFAQLKGTVKDESGKPIGFATVIVDYTQNGTISNEKGEYELSLQKPGVYTVLYQFLGYKTERVSVEYRGEELVNDVVLIGEDFQLDNIVITVGKNPADEIVRKAIRNKAQNTEGVSAFKADFYSKGMVKTLKLPQLLMKRAETEGGDLKNRGIDSTGRGIVYLSETVSEIQYQKPNKLKEHIVASKVSGRDNGYSFNTADESLYDFYENFLELGDIGIKLISPIADQAFSYYNYNLEATFKDGDFLINKVRVTPKVKAQPVFSGDLYLVDESGAIYGMDLKVTGQSLQEPVIEEITINQNFFYDEAIHTWVKRSQNIDLTFGILGARVKGVFLSVFNEYDFNIDFSARNFGKEVLSFEKDANKKDDSYWESNRLFSLTEEEVRDYQFKDSVQVLTQSPVYQDSIRKKGNKFHLTDPLSGYTYTGPDSKFKLNYDGVLNPKHIGFNTVQGLFLGTGLEAVFSNKEKETYTSLKFDVDYGFSSDRLRAYGSALRYFGGTHKSAVYVKGGVKMEQFHPSNINSYLNTAFSLLARKNYAKFYNNEELYTGYYGRFHEEALWIHAAIGYEQRKPLYNTTNGSFYNGQRLYTSNDPLQPADFESSPIARHHIYKFKLGVDLYLGQKYISFPDKRVYMRNRDYPHIKLYYEKGFAASESKLNYDLLVVKLDQSLTVRNKGEFSYALTLGHYFSGKAISFVDRKHFTGNETHLSLGDDHMKSFYLLPYYALNTDRSYIETHLEHNFRGFILNKIPLLRSTGWNTVIGYHHATLSDHRPYQEFSVGLSNLGFGKINFFRVDYLRAYEGNKYIKDGILIGFKKSL